MKYQLTLNALLLFLLAAVFMEIFAPADVSGVIIAPVRP